MAVLRARYLRRDESSGGYEAPMDMFRRTAAFVASAERGYPGRAEQAVTTWTARFLGLMAEGVFLPNSPTLMNAGRPNGLLSACAVLPVGDSLEEILTSAKNAGLIQKAGGGTGFSFSRLRPRGDVVGARNGVASGPVSFMGIFSEVTNAIQQGALRRGANMGVLRDDHPDIVEFINAKAQPGRLTNFNLSVAVSDGFIARLRRAADDAHRVRNPRNGEEGVLKKADGSEWTTSEVFDLLVSRAWETGEPGVVFLDRMNATNPTPRTGEIEAVNACGEQPLLPYESCNLGSINLTKFVQDADGRPAFDFDAFGEVIPAAVRFLDNVVDLNSYPLEECDAISRGNRKIGLGVMGFADVLIALGMPYDSPAAVAFGERLMRFLDECSHEASAALARERGCFPNWRGSLWQERGVPMRNACTTTVAPTGSLSIIAGCSAGMEPLFAAVFERNVLEGRRMIEANAALEKLARSRGFYRHDLMEDVLARGSLRGVAGVPEDIQALFATAHDVAPDWHVRMQAAFQKHCDASISKTVNLRRDATPDDVRRAVLLAYDLGCKGITVYRDGCRAGQPMATGNTQNECLTSGCTRCAS
jgi:ribonucleoside-diphosphate reductase alpha chain